VKERVDHARNIAMGSQGLAKEAQRKAEVDLERAWRLEAEVLFLRTAPVPAHTIPPATAPKSRWIPLTDQRIEVRHFSVWVVLHDLIMKGTTRRHRDEVLCAGFGEMDATHVRRSALNMRGRRRPFA
jgi:hypothetical protein